jgi:glycosyltransferase involved in cell wall biosynthesis
MVSRAAASSRPRAVVLVGGPAKPYSRALRIARTLNDEGYEVEIAAITAAGAPDVEREGPIVVRRYAPSGRFAPLATVHTVPGHDVPRPRSAPSGVSIATAPDPLGSTEADTGATTRVLSRPRGVGPGAATHRLARGTVRRMRRRVRWLQGHAVALRRHVLWPQTVRGWWATLDRSLEPADVYHACGILTIAPALAAARKGRRAGRQAKVVYDAVDDTFEGNNVRSMPRILRRVHAARETRWARAADARTTVNEVLAARLGARWRTDPPVVIPNWPEPRPASGEMNDLIRSRLGIPGDMRIVLFQGRLSPDLGLDEAAEAVLRVDRACLVLLGFGRWAERCRDRDHDPRFVGRHFTLPAVHPDELPAWTASADVMLIALPAVSQNQRDSTPNKFWESLLVGTPIVLGPRLDVMARIVADAEAGVVAGSLEPEALADAVRRVLDRDPAERAESRRRVAALAAERYNWTVAADRYRTVLGQLSCTA